MYHYCIFCLTQRAAVVQRLLEIIGNYKVISPKVEQRHWKEGKPLEKSYACLPGYLFIYSEQPITDFVTLRSLNGVIRQLGTEATGFQLTGKDYDFSKMLLGNDGIISAQKVHQVGERIELCDGLLKGMSGRITKVDRQYKRMQVVFMFDGMERKVWTGYDVISSAKAEQTDS